MRIFLSIIGVIVVLIALGFGYVLYALHDVKSEQITDDLHVIFGMGGNAGVLATGEGTVIIDTMTFESQGERIREVAESLTGEPVVMIINSHYHLDHTHGNPGFEPGVRVVATEKTLHYLETTDAEYFSGEAAQFLPNETFTDALDLTVGDKTMTLVHPGRGHTDGDLVVLMPSEGTIHMGDLFFNRHYPNIDLEAGGSIQEWGATLDNVFELDFDKVIPGHGPVSDPEGLRQFQRFINQLAQIGRDAKASGATLEATQQSDALTEDAGYTEITLIVPIGLNRSFVLGRTWEETHEAFDRLP